MFEEMRQALFVLRLIPGPCPDPDADGGCLDMGHMVGDDPQARRQCRDFAAHEAVLM
jgi:hypothetical protein